MSGNGGEKNVEGETEVKGRTARETARTEERGAAVGSKSVVCRWGIGADLGLARTPVHAGERERGPSTERKSEACTRARAPLTCVAALPEQFGTHAYSTSTEKTCTRCVVPRECTRTCVVPLFFFSSVWWIFFWWYIRATVGIPAPSLPVPVNKEKNRRSDFRITRTRAQKGARCVCCHMYNSASRPR